MVNFTFRKSGPGCLKHGYLNKVASGGFVKSYRTLKTSCDILLNNCDIHKKASQHFFLPKNGRIFTYSVELQRLEH